MFYYIDLEKDKKKISSRIDSYIYPKMFRIWKLFVLKLPKDQNWIKP